MEQTKIEVQNRRQAESHQACLNGRGAKEEGEANHPSRLYKEVWIGLGGTQSAVYATEVSAEEYLAYTTEETEKVEVYRLAEQLGGDIEAAIRLLAEKRRTSKT